VELNDIGHFRIEMPLADGNKNKDNDSQQVYLEVELMFCDLLDQGGPEKFQTF